MSEMRALESTPVTILSGFLGAGKSTLLNDLLIHPDFGDTALIINEFGDVSIDHDLVRVGEREMMVTTTGCMCCVAGSDIRSSLFELHETMQRHLGRSFSRVVVETTGLADPAPVVNQLIPGGARAFGLRDHVVARRFHLAGFVCVVDVTTAEHTMDQHFECLKQIAFADRIVLTKTDVAQGVDRRKPICVEGLTEQLAKINPPATIVDRHDSAFDIAELFRPRAFAVADRGEDVEGWLAIENAMPEPEASKAAPPAETTRHAKAGIESLALIHDEPVSASSLMSFLDLLSTVAGPRLLRLKGIVALEDAPDRPLVIHAVQHAVHKYRLSEWPSGDRRTRLVAITHNLDPVAVRSLFTVITGVSLGTKVRLVSTVAALALAGIAVVLALSFALRSVANAHLEDERKSPSEFHNSIPMRLQP
ncbi:MAG: GTP-binding protein [Pseudomonadota bacterium]